MSQRLYGGDSSRVLDRLGPWAAVAMVAISLSVLYVDLSRYAGPIGEVFLPSIQQPGGTDFGYPYDGARALLLHVNPYRNNAPELRDVYGRDMDGPGYPPTHFILYLPIALIAKANHLMASRIWFHLNLVWLITLSFVTWRLLRRLVPVVADAVWLLWPFFLFVLSMGSGMQLLLERGQSDLFTALLSWSAVLLSFRRRWFLAMFLATWATLIKGYPIIFFAGFGLLGLTRSDWKRTVLGGVVSALVFLGPVARYVPIGLAQVAHRSGMFELAWYNHSFKNLAYAISPTWASSGHKLFTAMALLATALCWVRTLRAPDPTERIAWLTLYATCSLGTILGYSSLSYPYNTIIVLPGVVLIALNQRQFWALAGAPPAFESVFGPVIALFASLLFIEKLGSDTFPGGAVGLLGIVTISGIFAVTRVGALLGQLRGAVSIPSSESN